MEVLEQALKYAANGWSVFPVEPGGKKPMLPWREESTDNPDRVREMWDLCPTANIGIDCGKSGLVVLDIDDVNAIPTLADKFGFDPTSDETAVARTGRGGYHIYYQAGDKAVRNSASKVAEHVDVRGDGGYVVAPPSSHESGKNYEWVKRLNPRPIPETVVDVFTYREEKPLPVAPPERSHEKWGQAILSAEAYAVETSRPGTRNTQLYESCLPVFSAVKGGHLDRDIAWLRMQKAGQHVGLSDDEVIGTMESAWSISVARHPRDNEPLPRSKRVNDDGERKGFRLLSAEDLENLPPPTWLLTGLLPEGQTWMYGEPGAGKTFLALDWAATVASKGLNVVYFAGEGVQGFARRVRAWHKVNNKDLSTFKVVPQAPHLMDPDSVDMLRYTVEQSSASLVVIDTFARAAVGADENSARDVGIAIDALDGLWRDLQCSSLVVHHSVKYQGVERGSSAIRGAADATWEVRTTVSPDGFLVHEAACKKMKDAEPPSSVLFDLRGYEDGAYIYPSASA